MEFIRILWCDNANIIRSKALYINKEIKNRELPLKVGISSGQQGVPVMYDQVLESSLLTPVGGNRIRGRSKDFNSITLCPGTFQGHGGYEVKG
ncbi:MAG: hypothetical protein KKA38_09460 [Euryarchaeota archaeon]|nr:hypothetical protein [Euryarchaeota archaeon]MBV1767995.1 hypothetical protein [Methanobacterium sp.]